MRRDIELLSCLRTRWIVQLPPHQDGRRDSLLLLTIHTTRRRLAVVAEMWWWSRRGVKAWRAGRHMARHALWLLLLLRRWCKTRTALSCCTCHDALKEVGRTMSDGWWWGLRWSTVGLLAWATTGFKFAA